MTPQTVLVKAIASGVAVANIYYAQPVLVEIAHTFGASPKDVGLVAVAIQVGYALGILFFVPFGDIAERRNLCVGLASVSVAALVGCALAPNLFVLAIAGSIKR
jgi:MFS family permease